MNNNNNAASNASNNSNANSKKPTSYNNKGKNVTPKGYLPPSMLKRFGIKENRPNIEGYTEKVDSRFSIEQTKRIKKMTEAAVTYRMMSKQCVTETRLPAPLRDVVKYFSYPMSGFGGGNTGASTNKAAANDYTDTTENT
jgi:hypothetical protein